MKIARPLFMETNYIEIQKDFMVTSGLGNMIKFAVDNNVSKCFRYEKTSLICEI